MVMLEKFMLLRIILSKLSTSWNRFLIGKRE